MTDEVKQRIQRYKESLGEQKLIILDALFDATESLEKGVEARRFRADHPEWFDGLRELEGIHTLLDRSYDEYDRYRVKPYALPLLSSRRALDLLGVMDGLLPQLQKIYRERLDGPVPIEELEALTIADKSVLHDVLYMMCEAHDFLGSRSAGFPTSAESYTHIQESVLQKSSSLENLTCYYDSIPASLNTMPAASALSGFQGVEPIELPSIFDACEIKDGAPEWLALLDEPERKMLLEVDKALKTRLRALSVMGIRALFDLFVQKHIKDSRNFKGSLEALKGRGYISAKQEKLIAVVFDVGSATMHRGHYPSVEDVETCVSVYGHIIKIERELRAKVEKMEKATPSRPPKEKRSKAEQ